ncbi:allantoinase AllB [Microbacterium sp. A196]|uniref:allantoinase AllB n=1 Tax=Microbacterium sp. A196 TaxID=3457320 RepID=UPI003FCF87C0
MRIVVASDKFKGSLTAPEVAAAVASGARRIDPAIDVLEIPVADGGEGTVDAAIAAGFEERRAYVTGPTGEQVVARYAVRSDEAVVEMAQASGLDLLPGGRKDATGATSLGTGELVRAALDAGSRRIVLGIGGSASTDGGAGLLQGLGARLLDGAGIELPLGGGALAALKTVDLSGLDPRLSGAELVLASDVDNPLLGESGAAAVFGPQKGASADDVESLDRALEHFVEVLGRSGGGLKVPAVEASERKGAGAAGGVGFAAIALGAERRAGIDVVLELTRLAERLEGADLVITGEGSLDEQSLMGKTPIGVARAAQAAGIPVHVVCGRSALDAAQIGAAGFSGVHALADLEPDSERSMADAGRLLEQVAARLLGGAAIAGSLDGIQSRCELIIRGRALIDGEFRDAQIGVRDGRIIFIAGADEKLDAAQIVELAHDEVLIPGLVDTHVHVNEPGRTEWEGFESATRAAAAGGVTTIVDMPLNSIPPTVTVEALNIKRAAAQDRVFVDVGFWGGVVPGNLDDLPGLHAAGVFGFKCFLLPSGVDEFPEVSIYEMRRAMASIAQLGSLLVVHAEDAHIIEESVQPGGREYGDFLASRPRSAEDAAISEVIRGAIDTGARAHILHLSNGDSIGRLSVAKAEGVDITVETCPHYLTLAAEDIPAGATAYKCCPPIREDDNRDELWHGLLDGTIDYVVSDHSPSTPEMKYAGDGDFSVAWGGIASLQLGLPLMWTEGRRRGVRLARIVELMSSSPADRIGLAGKGRIAVGAAADFAVFAPEETFAVDATSLAHRHPVTPYDGRELTGVVRATYLAGRLIDQDQPRGRLLRLPRIEIGAPA